MIPSLRELLDVAVEAAYLGGRRALGYFNTNVQVITKPDNTPVTCADQEAERLITEHIICRYPSHAVLGEEQGHKQGDADVRWIIDPIDGTKNFLRGVPLWGTLIGVEVNKVPSVGVIYLPGLDEMVCGALGEGARWNGRPARVSQVSNLSDAALVCTHVRNAQSRSDVYENLASQVKFDRDWGDAYGYALVATGRAEIMLDAVINPWDIAPMAPILAEAGGHFSTWSGEKTIWGPDAVATNGKLSAKVLEIMSREKRNAIKA